ncbi:substrate-binding periplasmic protein [Chitinimonas koreensis]|uniref:substrate-binding periplasmic protein n=1 Tax=Chitinimonas koreensis TaxID=356302 RepID=UPI000426914B|nr:transporter substrate-binding domain-containing protein [Chitinimonas koreensis]QNM98546.1 transporter substrate-binding domain-containing protein [Chitinimonas koreensis]
MKRLFLSLLLCCLAAPAAAAERVTLVSTDYPPYFSPNLAEDGSVAAIARAAFRAAGYEVELVFRPWARLMAEVESGQYDGVVAVWYKAERERFLAYSDPLVKTEIGFYGRRDMPIEVQNLGALTAYRVGTVRGYANPPVFDAAGLQVEDAVDDLTNLRKLAAGRLDLVLIDKALAAHLLRSELPAAAEKVAWRDPPIETMPLYLGIAKRKPDYPRKLADFNRGLAEIRRNGEFARILRRLPLAQ